MFTGISSVFAVTEDFFLIKKIQMLLNMSHGFSYVCVDTGDKFYIKIYTVV